MRRTTRRPKIWPSILVDQPPLPDTHEHYFRGHGTLEDRRRKVMISVLTNRPMMLVIYEQRPPRPTVPEKRWCCRLVPSFLSFLECRFLFNTIKPFFYHTIKWQNSWPSIANRYYLYIERDWPCHRCAPQNVFLEFHSVVPSTFACKLKSRNSFRGGCP